MCVFFNSDLAYYNIPLIKTQKRKVGKSCSLHTLQKPQSEQCVRKSFLHYFVIAQRCSRRQRRVDLYLEMCYIQSSTCCFDWLSEYIAHTGPLCACTERRSVVPCHTYTNPVSLPVKHRSSVGLWQTHSIVAAVPALPNVTGRFSSFESIIEKKKTLKNLTVPSKSSQLWGGGQYLLKRLKISHYFFVSRILCVSLQQILGSLY